MSKGWLVAMALLLSACSSTTPKTYYQLPQPSVATAGKTDLTAARTLWLSHVALADYLSTSGLVYQTNDVRYVIASNNLWASPLEQQLQQTLQSSLNAGLPGRTVSSQPLGAAPSELAVTVKAFHGRYDGKAVVQGEWTLQRGDRLLRQPFNLVLPVNDDGYDALVTTLAQGWQQVAQSIAAQIQRSE
ncbi:MULTISPECIES: membrane integrity-associated transporter subunit PqiC [Symbiopectobacterium]|uniref:membrane integrity-associated transporter subunit PqiC n=1 Tax=Symbiopectobacterium TaxID=801 RepID=UPI001A1EA02E|nr:MULTISPECIES: membrane integrity-associated transporter subunit PqiC [Symbiopectobacterium]MBG6247823.1 membrane integrity-associated transporter subunit PqiC [Candidatus Symbiopectobacterium sp. PLON1]MBT9429371.1 membrane integrity-associated transporter subunit PqiC [Candidatus Symbiopectobacterium endolongispinus]